MRIRVLDQYTIGHSSVAEEDIILGDDCGRFVPLNVGDLPEIITALEMCRAENWETVNPDEFVRRGDELDRSIEEKLGGVDETLEALYEATFSDKGTLFWSDGGQYAGTLPNDIYANLVELHEERG